MNYKVEGEMGQEKFTGEIENTNKVLVSKPERKRHFRSSKPR